MRSLYPRILSLKNDILEREIDIAFLQEMWEPDDNSNFDAEIEKLLEIDGYQLSVCV